MRLETLVMRLLRLALSRGVRQGLSTGLQRRPGPPARREAGAQGKAGEQTQLARQMGRRAGRMLRITRRLR